MKQLILFIPLIVILMGCQQNEEPVILTETGVVVNYAGTDYCSIIIELDNGQKIQPLYYPEDFEFVEGQRLLVNYTELPNIVSTCGKGTVCELLNVEVMDCGFPVTETEGVDVDTYPNDPLIIHEISLNENCLYLKVSYSGGCRNHEFILVKVDNTNVDKETAVLELRHDGNNDLCEAALSKELQFNMTSLKEAGFTKINFKALLPDGEIYNKVLEFEQ